MIIDDKNPLKEMFIKFYEKQITMDELNTEVAYWAISDDGGFEDLRPEATPYDVPLALSDYRNSDAKTKEKVKGEVKFWHRPDIKDYLDRVQNVKFSNIANKKWLKDILGWLPEGDVKARKKVIERLKDFE